MVIRFQNNECEIFCEKKSSKIFCKNVLESFVICIFLKIVKRKKQINKVVNKYVLLNIEYICFITFFNTACNGQKMGVI